MSAPITDPRDEPRSLLEEARAAMKVEHLPRYQHSCPKHGWETCGIAPSLLDPADPQAEHACSRVASRPPLVFLGSTGVREVPT